MRAIEKHPGLDYGLVISNMHVLDRFGSSVDEIKKDGFKIAASIHNTFDGYNHLTMAKSLSVFMLQLPEILQQMEADIVLLGGDRGEQLMGAIVGAHLYKVVAHVQAGEVSGNIDGVSRHAITKFAHIHFAANKDAADRILKMGEEPFRVHEVGAPQLDDFKDGRFTSKQKVYKKFGLHTTKPVMLVAQHSVTEDFDHTEEHMRTTLEAIKQFPELQPVIILNNSDAGSALIRRAIEQYRTPTMKIFPNVPREDYGGLMNVSSVLVGNSSSGILEAPSFKLPAVNIGRREIGRLRGINVIDVGHSKDAIVRGIQKALSPEFVKKMKRCVNPYGDGRSSTRIIDILASVPIDEKLLVKRLTY